MEEKKPLNSEPNIDALPRTIGYVSGTLMCVGMVIGSGIFAVPATILGEVGSVGMTILIFVIGALVSAFGTWSYCELGCMRPVSGGDKEYLDIAYPKPKGLLPFMFIQSIVLLTLPGSVAAVSIAFGENILFAILGSKEQLILNNEDPTLIALYPWIVRAFGVFAILFTTAVHSLTPKMGLRIQDILTVTKILVLFFVMGTGLVAATGFTSLPTADNFSNMFVGTKSDGNALASSLFSVFFAFDGWNNLNYCLDELIDPIKNLPKAAITGVAITSFLYISTTVAYFVVVPSNLIDTKSTLLAAQFSTMAFGATIGSRIMPIFIGLSAFGSGMCMAFAVSRITLSACKEGFMPYSNILGSQTSTGAPVGGLILNMVMSLLWMLGPPPGPIFKFLVELACYPKWIFYGLSVSGLLYLRVAKPEIPRPFKSFWITNILFILVSIFLAVFPFVPPAHMPADGLPYYLYALLGLVFLILCIPAWYFQVERNRKSKTEDDIFDEQSTPLKDIVHSYKNEKDASLI